MANTQQLIVESFKYGVDTRRSVLTSVPGTLASLVNGHITQGGAIEKRKAFVKLTRSGGGNSLPSNTFGLQRTATGLLVFGSQDHSGSTFPTGVSYQRLQHPDLSTAMSAVIHSDLFNGSAWVIAAFADGRRFGYYNGTLVYDITNGQVLPHLSTNTLLATELKAEFDRQAGYTTSQPGGATTVDVAAPVGLDYTATIVSSVAGSGTLTSASVSASTTPVTAVAAIGRFRVMGGSASAGTNKVSSVKVNNVTVTNGAVDWVTSNAATAAAIAASINAATSSPDYTATSDGDTVYISAVTTGTGSNDYVIEVNAAGDVCIGDCSFSINGTGFTVSALKVDGVSIITGALAGGYAYPAAYVSLSAFVTALASDINAGTTAGATHGIIAYATSNYLRLSKAQTKSSDASLDVYVLLTITANQTGGVGGGNTPETPADPPTPTAFSVDVTPRGETVAYTSFVNFRTSSTWTPVVTGGVGPFTYEWQEGSGDDSRVITISPATKTTTFKTFYTKGCSLLVRVKVTDSTGATALSPYYRITFSKWP